MSLLAVTSVGPPTQHPTLNLDDFRFALDWILDYSASDIPSPSSIAEQFFISPTQLQSSY
jgi:hypothetical protein